MSAYPGGGSFDRRTGQASLEIRQDSWEKWPVSGGKSRAAGYIAQCSSKPWEVQKMIAFYKPEHTDRQRTEDRHPRRQGEEGRVWSG